MRLLPHECARPAGTLAIDTSTERAGVALAVSNGVWIHSWPASRAQTTTVLPVIDRMVRAAEIQPTDVSGLVVAVGPGTFTGLRVGLAIAKGIVAAQQVPLVGIPTLDIVFAMHRDEEIIAVLPAGRGRVVWQRRDGTPVNASIAELIESTGGADLVGEFSPDQEVALREAGIRVQVEHRDPSVLLRLGSARIAAGDVDDPVTLEPTYLHGIPVTAGPIEDRLKKKP
jgi:tRNA threonylcarbamoyladenosine biosynthesis protein TsaB